jgi:hypothetical protein
MQGKLFMAFMALSQQKMCQVLSVGSDRALLKRETALKVEKM